MTSEPRGIAVKLQMRYLKSKAECAQMYTLDCSKRSERELFCCKRVLLLM